ncbi:Aste57867_25081 [Aphanomyces stellatus]|uniref:Aste57867_25081 protein n=1 Tax=Aphanomyces stellatus TaxID=120398 RepID=A0A485LSW1_9STRA|nr:hypothetical protein As57867_025003 [Aphanomyces stellatus]VFU01712.1 Aste57867_25081 [Aphanomyces stellatus]
MSKPVLEAASVVVFNHLEQILFVRRPKSSKAWANMMVFPGGKVDACDNSDDPSPVPHVPIRFFNAAIRELFEEVDVSLTEPPLWDILSQTKRREWRHKIIHEKIGFDHLLRSKRVLPSHEKLLPFSQVITPEGSPHRFDTWFFLTHLTSPDEATLVETNGSELEECLWLTPQDALNGYADGAFAFATPQLYLLHEFQQYGSLPALWEGARSLAQTPRPAMLPQRLPPSTEFPGVFTVFPGDPLYQPTSSVTFPHRMHLHPTDPSKSTFLLPHLVQP